MSHFKLGGLAGVFLILATGCGMFKRGNNDVSSDAGASVAADAARKLDIRILSDGTDPDLPTNPSGNLDGQGEGSMTASGTELVYWKNILLPPKGGKQLFFVWKEEALGTPIVDAKYEHRTQTSDNRLVGAPDLSNASYDGKSRFYFIPINKLLGGDPWNADPELHHLLVLDLVLKDGSHYSVTLRFTLIPPPAKINYQTGAASFNQEVNPFRAMQSLRELNWILKTDSIENLSKKPMQLLIAGSAQNLKLTTAGISVFSGLGSYTVGTRSQILLKVGLRIVNLTTGVSAPFIQDPIKGTFTIMGREKLRLEWIAYDPRQGADLCTEVSPQISHPQAQNTVQLEGNWQRSIHQIPAQNLSENTDADKIPKLIAEDQLVQNWTLNPMGNVISKVKDSCVLF